MKAGIFFTGSGPIFVLTSYASLPAPNFVDTLAAKGISKFIAYEVAVDEVKKKYGKHFEVIWRVIEKKEVWLNTSDDPETGDYRAIAAIYLCYRRAQEGKQPGVGQMLGYAYSLHDNTFETNWEIAN